MQELFDKLGVNVNVTFHLLFIALIWVRLLAMASMIPFLLGKPVPRSVVVAVTMLLAAYGYIHLVPSHPPVLDESPLNLFMLLLKEAFYGFVIGIAISVIFYGIQAAGAMVDNQRGVSIARILIPQLDRKS